MDTEYNLKQKKNQLNNIILEMRHKELWVYIKTSINTYIKIFDTQNLLFPYNHPTWLIQI